MSPLNDRIAREQIVRAAELAALWIAFCMRSKQVMTAHLLLAIADNPLHADTVGLIGGDLNYLAREIRTLVDGRAPKVTQPTLPEHTRGLVRTTHRLIGGESVPLVLATDTRYQYLLDLLEKTGFGSCLPTSSYSFKQHAARLIGRSPTAT